MRVRRWRAESCRLHICRSTANILPPPEAPWPVREWLRGGGQASCRGECRGDADEREGEWRISRVGNGEGACVAVVGDRETKKFGGDGMGFGVV
jgi:hypothetical protein